MAEIERRVKRFREQKDTISIIKTNTYKGLLSFIDTLEVKEVDLKLTLEDVSMIRQIMFDYNRQVRNEMSIPNDEEYCKEVLKRFKAQKREEV